MSSHPQALPDKGLSAHAQAGFRERPRTRTRGAVLVIVLLTCLGLAALALYFANSMSLELKASDNTLAQAEARQAVEGGARYVAYILSEYGTNGTIPTSDQYKAEALSVGQATVWLIGRDNNMAPTDTPFFGLVDESSKMNLNRAGVSSLQYLPGVTADFAAAIVDWRDSNSTPGDNGAEDETYARLDPPRTTKNSNFESTEELRLVYGADLDILFGEDANLNGALDPNEDDGETSPPNDIKDGVLAPGVLEYVTAFSKEPTKTSDGTTRLNIATVARNALQTLLASKLDATRAQAIVRTLPPPLPGSVTPPALTSVAQLYVSGNMTSDEILKVHAFLRNPSVTGLINVNTAPETVLASIPGIGTTNAATITAYRQAHPDLLTSMGWLKEVVGAGAMLQAGPYITDLCYQFTADIAAVGHNGHGYCRIKFIFDTSSGTPRILYRRDLTALGWALGSSTRQTLAQAKDNQ